MNSPSPQSSATPESLLAHASWVRDLAQRLVGDPDLADDLAQETYLAALDSPPREGPQIRGWLGTVLRNFMVQNLRRQSRSANHEEASLAELEKPSEDNVDEVIERASVHRRVVDLVLDLDDPYRTVLLLRFFDGLTPLQISKRTQVSVATIKTQQARGLEKLRTRLEQESGSREAWIALLLPVLQRPFDAGQLDPANALEATTSATYKFATLGAALVNAKIAVATVVLLAAGSFAALEVFSPESSKAAQPSKAIQNPEPQRSTVSSVDKSDRRVDEIGKDAGRTAVAVSPKPTASTAAVAAPEPTLRIASGRLLDMNGAALGDVRVRFLPGEESAVTDSTGAFSIELERVRSGNIAVDDSIWTTVLHGVWEQGFSDSETVIVAAPRLTLGGTTIDQNGIALANVSIHYELPENFRSRFQEILDYSGTSEWVTTSKDSGTFELEVPDIEGALLHASKLGYENYVGPLPAVSSLQLNLTMMDFSPEGDVVRGIVVDSYGVPVGGARVSVTFDSTVTNEDGTFVIETNAEGSVNRDYGNFIPLTHDTIQAVATGHMPAKLVATGRNEAGQPEWPDWVQLELGLAPLSVSGRVVDRAGKPRGGVYVWVADPTLFGQADGEVTHVETLLAGRGGIWAYVESDATGAFEIDGLQDREYVLELMDPSTLEHKIERGVAAGQVGLEFTLSSELFEEVHGRVVDTAGDPVPNVSVRIAGDAFRLNYKGAVFGTRHAGGATTFSDEEGRFVFQNVAREFAYLRFDGDSTIPIEVGRDHEGGLGDLIGDDWRDFEVTLYRRCPFQIELDPLEPIDFIQMLDEEGEDLPINQFEGNMRTTRRTFPVSPGQSASFAVSELARHLVLMSGGQEVRRVPVDLKPGELNRILRP